MDNRNRKLRRRLRIIAARAMLCVVVFSALGFTGYRSAGPEADGSLKAGAGIGNRE